MNIKKNHVKELSFAFSLQIIKYCDMLVSLKKYTISKQLQKSGTSIGANIREAQQAESKLDFIHKLKISLKEADETEYWLLLCKFSENYPDAEGLLMDIIAIKKLLISIVLKAQHNLNGN